MKKPPYRPPVDINGAADYTGFTVRFLRRQVSQRSIPFVKRGRLLRFLPDELDAWLAEGRVQPSDMRRSTSWL